MIFGWWSSSPNATRDDDRDHDHESHKPNDSLVKSNDNDNDNASSSSSSLPSSPSHDQQQQRQQQEGVIKLYVPREMYMLPIATSLTGFTLGLIRSARFASLRYLAEHAHKPPRTVQGWYFYHKTKNYRVLWAGVKGGVREGGRFGMGGVCWVGFERGARWMGGGVEEGREVVGGMGTAGLAALIYGLPRRTAMQVVLLGGMGGGAMSLLRWAKERVGVEMSREDSLRSRPGA